MKILFIFIKSHIIFLTHINSNVLKRFFLSNQKTLFLHLPLGWLNQFRTFVWTVEEVSTGNAGILAVEVKTKKVSKGNATSHIAVISIDFDFHLFLAIIFYILFNIIHQNILLFQTSSESSVYYSQLTQPFIDWVR
jgi:hypothetical protein